MCSAQGVHKKLSAHTWSKQVPIHDVAEWGEAKLYPSLNINTGIGLEQDMAIFRLRESCECLVRY